MSAGAFSLSLQNVVRWCWCMSAAIAFMAWMSGSGDWAAVAAFNAACVVWALSGAADEPNGKP